MDNNFLIIYFHFIRYHFRTEQTATLKVDGGHIITGASPGKLRQLNGNGHLFIGNKNSRFKIDYKYTSLKSRMTLILSNLNL